MHIFCEEFECQETWDPGSVSERDGGYLIQ